VLHYLLLAAACKATRAPAARTLNRISLFVLWLAHVLMIDCAPVLFGYKTTFHTSTHIRFVELMWISGQSRFRVTSRGLLPLVQYHHPLSYTVQAGKTRVYLSFVFKDASHCTNGGL
jgi:hypothetical protein